MCSLPWHVGAGLWQEPSVSLHVGLSMQLLEFSLCVVTDLLQCEQYKNQSNRAGAESFCEPAWKSGTTFLPHSL